MRRVVALWGLAFVAAVSICVGTSSATFEHELIKADFDQRGPLAQAALAQYPDATPRVFAIYGQTPEFDEVLRRYGYNQIVPIIDKCLQNGDDFLQAGSDLQQFAGSLLHFQRPDPKPLTPVECGWNAIALTLSSGNDFLGEFTVDDHGEAHRLPGSTVLAGVKRATLSGLETLERKLVVGDDTNAGDWGNAALDLVVVGAAGKSVAELVKLRVAAQAGRPMLVSELDATRTEAFGFARAYAPTLAKYATLGGAIYIVVRHPGIITGAAGTLAQIFGMPPFLVQILAWTLIIGWPLRLLVGFIFAAGTGLRVFGRLSAGLVARSSVLISRLATRRKESQLSESDDDVLVEGLPVDGR